MKSLVRTGATALCLLLSAAAILAESYNIAVIPKGTSHEFWKSIHAGALQAKAELARQGTRVNIHWKGPIREDDRDQQIAVVESFVVRRVNGIVLAPLDSKALVGPVETALRAKVPVIIIDSALDSDKPVSYIATDNFRGGQIAGEHIGKVLNGKGNVIMLRYQVGSASTEQREAGFLDAMAQFPDIQLLSVDQYSGATRDSAYQAAQNLINRFGKEADAIFAPCEPVTIGVMLALKDAGQGKGKIKLVGFDAGSRSVEGLKDGDVEALVVQNPMRMGYLGVTTMIEHLQGKSVPKVVDTGVYLVTRENMNEAKAQELLFPPLKKYLRN